MPRPSHSEHLRNTIILLVDPSDLCMSLSLGIKRYRCSEVGAVPANHLLQSACLLLCEEITSAPLPSNLDVLDKWSVFVSLVLHLLSALLFPYVALRLNSCVQRVRASIPKSPSIVEFNPQVRCLDVGKCFVVPRY